MRLTVLTLAAVAAAVALTGCQKQLKAPRDAGVCYFIGHPDGPDGKPTVKFNPIARDVPDLEHCAVKLYGARMSMLATNTAGNRTEGSYQGSFLFVTNSTVDYSQTYEGPAFPFLVKDPYSDRLVTPGSVEVEDTPDNEPHQVEVPKNLPQKNDQGVVVTQNPKDEPPAPQAKKP